MKNATRRFAVAAALLALPAVTTLAADPAPADDCWVCREADWPAGVKASPAVVVSGPARTPDTTQAQIAGVSPAIPVTEHRPDAAVADWSSPAPEHHAAVVLGTNPAHVAAR